MDKGMDTYLTAKGVKHQKTAMFNREQIGVAERLNGTLVKRVRAMLNDHKLTTCLWGEAMHTANFLRNIRPLAVHDTTGNAQGL
jgi:hypothetical protein